MRIVSLCPSLTELVFDLGLGDDLVGITRYCVHPADRVGGVESVGGTKDPEVERILELRPDLVLMNDEENRLEDAEALTAGGVRLHTSMPRTVEETAAMVRSIAEALDAEARGESIARDIELRAARVREEAARRPRVPFAYLIWKCPWMAAGEDTFASGLLEMAGGVNVLRDRTDRYPTFETEALAALRPQLVLLGSEPYPFAAKDAAALARALELPQERVVLADGEYLSWHGSRTPDGIDHAAQLISAARL
jgi:ABC-type Fe3+-hydroxamate transport system substrate-binding protein